MNTHASRIAPGKDLPGQVVEITAERARSRLAVAGKIMAQAAHTRCIAHCRPVKRSEFLRKAHCVVKDADGVSQEDIELPRGERGTRQRRPLSERRGMRVMAMLADHAANVSQPILQGDAD